MSSWPKIIRDPVHDIISFEDNGCDRLLLELINTREFQRLRRIKQLGMSEMVFPGANHSRFAHSIGVMHNARRFLTRLAHIQGKSIEESIRTAVLAAALLHDLGHGPFSHTFEKITGEDHEERTIEVIRDDSTAVNKVLREHNADLPKILCKFFDEDPEVQGEAAIPKHFVQIVSSQLDADRFDYLLRDAHASGADYGKFDSRWIIQHLQLNPDKSRLQLSNKAFIATEGYVLARYHMYRAVYFHKTTRAAEVMLRVLFKRFKSLLKNGGKPNELAPGSPAHVVSAFQSAGKMSLPDYLRLDDHSVSEFAKACLDSSDSELKEIATGILERHLFKAVEATGVEGSNVGHFTVAVTDMLKNKGINPDVFMDDSPADVPYKPYDPDSSQPATQIYLENSVGKPCEFGELSPVVEVLKKKYSLLRYYFPEAIRGEVEKIAVEHLKGRKP
jgi:HD superfamily phosphohydrolase